MKKYLIALGPLSIIMVIIFGLMMIVPIGVYIFYCIFRKWGISLVVKRKTVDLLSGVQFSYAPPGLKL